LITHQGFITATSTGFFPSFSCFRQQACQGRFSRAGRQFNYRPQADLTHLLLHDGPSAGAVSGQFIRQTEFHLTANAHPPYRHPEMQYVCWTAALGRIINPPRFFYHADIFSFFFSSAAHGGLCRPPWLFAHPGKPNRPGVPGSPPFLFSQSHPLREAVPSWSSWLYESGAACVDSEKIFNIMTHPWRRT